MALPDTISGVEFADQNNHQPPFKSSGGNFYYIGRGDSGGSTDDNLRAFKSTNPGTAAWSNVGTDPTPSSTNVILSLSTKRISDVIHVVVQLDNDNVYYASFDMSSDTWSSVDTVETIANAITLNACDIEVQGDGDKSAVYQGPFHKDMGTSYESVFENRDDGGGWGTSQEVDAAAAFDYSGPRNALGISDTTHVVYVEDRGSNDPLLQRAISSAGTLQTQRDTLGNVSGIITEYPATNGVTFVRSSTTRLRFGFFVATDEYGILEFDAAADPSSFTVSGRPYSTNDPRIISANIIASLAVDGSTLHSLWSSGEPGETGDLYSGNDQDSDTWTAAVEEFAGTVNDISCNVYDNGGTVLAYVYDDGGTIKYNEISLASGSTTPKTIAATAIGVAVLTPVPIYVVSIDATAVGTPVFVKKISKTLSATAVGTAVFVKKVSKTLAATAVGSAVLTPAKLVLQTLAATAVGIATLTPVQLALQAIDATAVGVASFTKKISKTLEATGVGTPAIIKNVGKTLAATAVGVPAFVKTVKTTLAATAIGVPGLSTVITYARTLAVIAVAVVVLTPATIFVETLSATAIGVAGFVKTIKKTLSATAVGTAQFIKKVSKTLSATAAGVVTLTPALTFTKTLGATATAIATLATNLIVSGPPPFINYIINWRRRRRSR